MVAVAGFHGHAAALAAVGAVLARAAGGRLAIALVQGEAGIGKTRLLLEALGGSTLRLFLGRSGELERTRPFSAIAEALGCDDHVGDPMRARLVNLITVGELGSRGPVTVTSDPGLQFRAVEGFVRLVEEEALRAPVALALDDLQWADPSTILTLGSIVRRTRGLPVALLMTMRPLPRTRELSALVEMLTEQDVTHLILSPLEDEAVHGMVEDMVGAIPGPGLRRSVETAGGNPLFITELVGALLGEGLIEISGGRAEITEAALSPNVQLTILRRIGYLGEPTLDALRAASLLGSRFTVTDLSTTSGRTAEDVAASLMDAFVAGILEDEDQRVRFRHDLVREAIYQDIPASARAAMHREVARRLADSAAPILQVAEHVVRGARPGDTEAVEMLSRAAADAAPRSPFIAAELIQHALEIAGPASPLRDRLLAQRIPNAVWSGLSGEAESVCREMLARVHDASVDGTLWIFLIQTLLGQGRAQEALQEADRALVASGLAEAEFARILAWGAHARMLVGDLDGALEWGSRARAMADELDEDLTACIATCAVAMVHQLRGHFTEGIRLATEAVAIGDRSRDQEGHRFQLGVFQGLFLMDLDRIAEGIVALRRGIQIAEQLGARWNLPLYQIGLIVGNYLIGEWDATIAEFDTSLDLALETGTRHGMVYDHSIRSMIALHRDDRVLAAKLVDEAESELSRTGPQYRHAWTMWARALLQDATGSVADACATLSAAWDRCVGLGVASEFPVLGPDLVRLALAMDERSRAEEVATALEELAAREDAPWLAGGALRSRGLIDDDPERLLAAVAAYRDSPRLLERAQTCEDAGNALARAGRTEEARDLSEEALELFGALDAALDVARVEAGLRARGVRRGARGGRKRPSFGWDSLTETENRVVTLASEGLSNPQIAERLFLSSRTVQTHLKHVFAKLGLSSRVELATQAVRRHR